MARGLVLSGGGAKGAYEAGVIATLANQTPDGTRLPRYNGVAGTSIGCLNGWFLATGQYTRMRELWMNVAQERVFRLKPEFAKIEQPNAGILDRFYQLLHLGFGVRSHVQGLCQTEPALHWIQRYVDPSRPALMPFAWAATNITRQTPEYFYRLPPGVSASTRNAVLAEFGRTLNRGTVVREATDDLLHRAIFASACLPVIFDPIELPAPDGNGMNQYCDGGLTANTPLSFARIVARNVDVILLSPPYSPVAYGNAVDIGFAAYDTMQRYILYAAMRSASVENVLARRNPTDTGIAFLRPTRTLPVDTTTFNDQRAITQAYEMGRNDAKNGFTLYTPNAL
ncbi:MAG TPA: patatin-like phospholipase family protein [Candidatus Baltobacteraceae bacterium]|nr:patatin-like phospholipase family protein [Candidatus Baltobacteraceae bacterium]